MTLAGTMVVMRVRKARGHRADDSIGTKTLHCNIRTRPVHGGWTPPCWARGCRSVSLPISLALRASYDSAVMSEQRDRVIAVGEAIVELVRGGDGRFGIGCAGDTFNVAVYLARAGINAGFATALGDDPYSEAILALAAAEGVACDLVLRTRGRLPGLVAEGVSKAKLVYFSGITLSLYSNMGIGRFLALVEMVRQQGVKVAFDGNFRPRGWRGDLSRTRTVFMEALKRVDIALPAYDDEAVLWGDPSPEATVARLQAFGIPEIVVKNGPNSALVASGGQSEFVPVPEVVVPVDTTAAGDSFNAAYLAARLSGKAPADAAAAAHRLASQVIRHRGALMPRAAAALH